MDGIAIWRGFWRHSMRSPSAWLAVLATTAACPLAHLLSPFPWTGIDPTQSLLWAWSVPAAVLGGGLAAAYLSSRSEFLAHLSPRTRWNGELITLVATPWVAQGVLLLGATLVLPRAADLGTLQLGAWALGCLTLNLHLAALAILLLRAPMSGALRLVVWWSVLLLGPEWMGTHRMPLPLDIGRHLREVGSPQVTEHQVATTCLWVGLLALGALASLRLGAQTQDEAGTTP